MIRPPSNPVRRSQQDVPSPTRRRASAAGWLEVFFTPALGASLAAGVGAAAWTALTLAEFGHFVAIVPLLAFPAAAAAVFALLTGGRIVRESKAATLQDLLALCIACATLFLSIPADENLLGGHDPGVYVHIAATVARTGSLVMEEPDLAALDAGGAPARLPQPRLGHRAVPRDVSPVRRQGLPAVLPPLSEPDGRRLVDRRHPGGAAGQPAAQRGGDPRPVRRRVAAHRAALGAGGRPRPRPLRRAAAAGQVPDRRVDDAVLPARRRGAAGPRDAGRRAAAGPGAPSPGRRSAWRS